VVTGSRLENASDQTGENEMPLELLPAAAGKKYRLLMN
jgi:hypothetical protein